MEGIEKYKDIINLPHHISKKHPQMSMQNRAAQFAPFAALVGHDAAVEETARFTTEKKELDENLKEILDEKLQQIIENKNKEENQRVIITYFEADKRKDGGSYKTAIGIIKRIDDINNMLVLEDKTKIPLIDIIEITEDVSNEL